MPGSIIVPHEALLNWANAQINDLPTMTDMYLRAFQYPFDVDLDTELADLLPLESTFFGYVERQLSDWSVPVIVVDDASTEAAVATFSSPGDTTEVICGLFATDVGATKLWWAATLVSEVPVPSGGNIDVAITLLIRSIYSS